MASRALIARLSTTCSSWCGSTMVVHRPPATTVSISMCSPMAWRSSSSRSRNSRPRLVGCGRSGWRAGRSWRASLAPRSTESWQHRRACRAGALHQRLQQLQIAGDHLQHVVEIMGHAARELADGLELLRLVQRLPAQLQRSRVRSSTSSCSARWSAQGLLRQHLGGDVMTLAENTGDPLVLAEHRLENEVEVASLGLATGLRAHAHGEVTAEIGRPVT